MLLKLDFLFEQKLKQVLFYLFISLFGINYQKGKIRIFFIFTLPILQRLNIVLFVHVLTTFSQLLVVNDINVGTLHVMILHFACIIFEASENKLFINLFVEAKSKKCNFFLLQEIVNKTMRSFPLLLINCLQNNSLLRIRDVNLISELPFLHSFKYCYIANSCTQRTDVKFLFEPHLCWCYLFVL